MLSMYIHICKNVEKHAWTLNIPTSGIVNSSMKRREKNRAFTMFITFSSFTKKCHLKKI